MDAELAADLIRCANQAVRCLMTKMHPIITTIYTHVGEQKREVFERYGIKSFCKVFCDNDLCMSVMHRKAKFIRHSDLVDGHCCHDEVINLEERK